MLQFKFYSRIIVFAGWTLFSSSLVSCYQAQEAQVPANSSVDIDSLIDHQAALLSRINPVVLKYGNLSGRSDTVTTVLPDSLAWSNELDIFRQMNLVNKPVNRDSYKVKSGLPDPNSNLLVMEFTAEEDLPLKFLRIYYAHDLTRIRKLEALYTERNALYSSSRFLTLILNNIYNKTLVSSYTTIEGGQKMFLGDSVNFKLQTTLRYPPNINL